MHRERLLKLCHLDATDLGPANAEHIWGTLLHSFADVFDEDGTLPPMAGQAMKLYLKPDATPFAITAPRQVPIPIMAKVKELLDTLERQQVITKQTAPTDWVHPMVVVQKKSGAVRVCVDYTKLNVFLRRPVYPAPSPAEVARQVVPDAAFFSTLDARLGYFQVPLEPKSQELTTFLTPWGHYRYRRSPHGHQSRWR